MAISINHKLSNGVTVTVAKLITVMFDNTTQKAEIVAGLWLDQAAIDEGKQPVSKFTFQLDADLNQALATEALAFLDQTIAASLPE